MRFSRLGRLAAGLLLATVVAACGGSSGPGNDPAGTVKALAAAINAGQLEKVPDFACAAQKEQVKQQFDFSGLAGEALGGMDVGDIGDAIKINIANLKVTEKSREGDTATVTMAGTMKMTFDKDKLKALVKKAAEASGMPFDDAQIEAALAMMSGLGGEQELNDDLTLKNEGGTWLICD